MVTVDQAEDIMADDTYAALLHLALSGKGEDCVWRTTLSDVFSVEGSW